RARDIDDAMLTPSTAFYVLKKTDYSHYNHDEFLEIFEETFNQCQDIVKKMLEDASQGCQVIRYLKPESIVITPVWGKASCNGWVINFNLDYPIEWNHAPPEKHLKTASFNAYCVKKVKTSCKGR